MLLVRTSTPVREQLTRELLFVRLDGRLLHTSTNIIYITLPVQSLFVALFCVHLIDATTTTWTQESMPS